MSPKTIAKDMVLRTGIFKLFLLLSLLLALGLIAAAQPPDRPQPDPESQNLSPDGYEGCRKTGDKIIDEMRIKTCIAQQKKEYQQLIGNGEEAARLSAELDEKFAKGTPLTAEDQKKLDRLEKLFKKIRNTLGGEEDDEPAEEDKPLTLKNAFDSLKEKTANLLSELKKSTRYSVSVVAIQGSNAVLRIVRFIRFSKN